MSAFSIFNGCSKRPDPSAVLPPGWRIAEFPDVHDLRHSKAYKDAPGRLWEVSRTKGSLTIRDLGYDKRNGFGGDSWETAGVPEKARKLALLLGSYLVETNVDIAQRRIVAVSDGWLVGFNAGEWAGGLCWVSKDGSKGRFLMTSPHLEPPPPPPLPPGEQPDNWQRFRAERYQAMLKRKHPGFPGWIPWTPQSMEIYIPENVHAIEPIGDAFLVFEGLAHLGTSRGKIVRVARNSAGEWAATELSRLDGAPALATRIGDNQWVAFTTESLFCVDGDGRTLKKVPLPEALYTPLWGVVQEGPGRWLVISQTALYRLAEGGKSTLILCAEFIDRPEMNSIVRMEDGTVYIGMRHYILRLTKNGNSYRAERLEPVV
jgi:hypothetical protein